MKKFLFLPALFTALSAAAAAQTILVQPQARVVNRVINTQRLPLAGTHPAAVDSATIGGRLGPNKTVQHAVLVLNASDEQEAALNSFLDEQQDRKSPYFHKWLTPADFGRTYGVAASDISAVTAWLQDSGLTVEQVAAGGRLVQFSGPIRSVEAAFGTEVHNVTIDGVAHVSNITDLTVPQALAPVVKGLARLNNFFSVSNAVPAGTVQVRRVSSPQEALAERSRSAVATNHSLSGGAIAPDDVTPNYGSATGTHYVSPGDVNAIFNATPLLNANIDGTGQTIAVLARSNINLSDVASFRTLFGLGGKLPKVTLVGTDPGLNGDDGEAYLDAEWAGAVAKNADINFIVSGTSLFSDGIDNAALYAVDNNIGDIISLSYGGCEKNFGASGTAFWNTLWKQAAAQGQTAMVSSGDSGAAGCDSSGATYATGGYGVNALGSSNYNVSVGGSMFVDWNPSQYWGASGGTTIPFANALSYIPEAPLNQSRATTTLLNSGSTAYTAGTGIFSAGGGVSVYSPRPAWQVGSGIGADPAADQIAVVTDSPVTGMHRLVPDIVSISANQHDGTLYCAAGICSGTAANGLNNAGIVGGTSVATPVWASAQALINQKNGGRQGNANYYYYKLANNQYTASTTACQAILGTTPSSTPTLPAATCNFQDIVTGSIRVPTASSGAANIGFDAAVGFDEASGLGSANITNMANNWSNVTTNATVTRFSLLPLRNFAHGTNKTASVQVSPASGPGTPTGDVSLIATAVGSADAPQVLTLSGGSATATINSLPGGTYAVYAHYAGDGTFAPSDSLPVTVAITKENSSIDVVPYQTTVGGAYTQTNAFSYGAGQISLNVFPSGNSGAGVPSGTVTHTLTRNGSAYGTYQTNIDPQGITFLSFGPVISVYYFTSSGPSLPVGNYTLTAAYSGDASFNASTKSTSFSVARVAPAVTLSVPLNTTAGQQATLGFKITTPAAAAAATGTVTFTDTTTGTTLGTVSLTNGSAVLTTSAIVVPGSNNISAQYSGDPNYLSSTNAQATTVAANTAPTVVVSTTGTLTTGATGGIGLRATLTPSTATGSVTFYEGSFVIGSATLTSGIATLTGVQLAAGSHTVTATYLGSASNSAATGSLTFTMAQNTTATTLSAPPLGASWGAAYLSSYITRSPSNTGSGVFPLTGLVTYTLTNTVTNAVSTVSAVPVYDPAYSYYVGTLRVPESVTPGSYSVTAAYAGDANYKPSSSALVRPMTITKALPALTLADTNVVKGSSTVTITALLAYPVATAPTGSPTITVNGNTMATTCTGGGSPRVCSATFSTATLAGGQTAISANYAGDANYLAAPTAIASLFVAPDLTGVVLTVNPTTTTVGSSINLSVKVKDRDNLAIVPTGTVSFYDNNVLIGTNTLVSGTASRTYQVQTMGNHTITATYTPANPATFTSGTSTTSPVVTVN